MEITSILIIKLHLKTVPPFQILARRVTLKNKRKIIKMDKNLGHQLIRENYLRTMKLKYKAVDFHQILL